jgi:simple sugar transport system substrate-binding protein/basic membrane protein A
MFNDIVKTALAGNFTGSKYNANYRVGYKTGDNPFIQSKFGPSVTDATKKLVDDAKVRITGSGSPFTGPIVAQDGSTMIPAGTTPDYAAIEDQNTKFVQGVVGELPKS